MKVASRRLLFMLVGCALSGSTLVEAQHYQQANLVSDVPGMATFLDPHLVNPWGLSRSAGSPWWVANNGSGTSTLYDGTGAPQPLVVTIPPATGSGQGTPTGTVFNGTTDFALPSGAPTRFLFAAEDGSITGWNSGTSAVVVATNDGSMYKGMAIAGLEGVNYLYVANFLKKRIDVFDTHFQRVRLGRRWSDDWLDDSFDNRFAEAFEDRRLPRSYTPFNVQNIGDNLYVSYAKLDAATGIEVTGAGLGFVDVFTPAGRLVQRLEHGEWLNAPWGLVLAPGDFGAFSHHVLVGQFGSGEIAAFNAVTGRFVGKVRNTSDAVLSIDGLWALSAGNGGRAGSATTLYFTAGIQDEAHGLLGTLTPVPAENRLGNGQ
jgi:uncharacterized protein (TIGR03118 family)